MDNHKIIQNYWPESISIKLISMSTSYKNDDISEQSYVKTGLWGKRERVRVNSVCVCVCVCGWVGGWGRGVVGGGWGYSWTPCWLKISLSREILYKSDKFGIPYLPQISIPVTLYLILLFSKSSLQCGESTWPKWLNAWSLLLFLAPHQVRFFRISRFIPDWIYSNKAQSTRKIKLFLQSILQSGMILKNIQRMFFVTIHVNCSGSLDWQQKHSLNVLENYTKSQYSTYTTRKSMVFRVFCTLF